MWCFSVHSRCCVIPSPLIPKHFLSPPQKETQCIHLQSLPSPPQSPGQPLIYFLSPDVLMLSPGNILQASSYLTRNASFWILSSLAPCTFLLLLKTLLPSLLCKVILQLSVSKTWTCARCNIRPKFFSHHILPRPGVLKPHSASASPGWFLKTWTARPTSRFWLNRSKAEPENLHF
jgi:hypothetical protein